MHVDTTGWRLLGDTTIFRHFEIEPGILVILPHAGASDDLTTATENWRFQREYLASLGRPGVLVIFLDRLVSQEREARRLYQEQIEPRFCAGGALVGSTLLGRAIGSFFFGLSRPKVPIKMFAELDEALAWARSVNEGAAKGPR
jgi:hypothetical protein